MKDKSAEGKTVFVSYAHEDDNLRKELDKHLSLLKRQHFIKIWHDQDISAGTEWEREISTHLNTADIILLLISPDFMASKYCFSVEVECAMERHERGEAQVIPIIARPVHWQSAPFGKLQALPTGAKPIQSSNWHYVDEALFDVAEGIRKTVEALNTKTSAILSPSNPRSFSESSEIVGTPNRKLANLTDQDTQTILQQSTPASLFRSRSNRRRLRSTVFVLLCLALVIGNNIVWFSTLQQDQLHALLTTTVAANAYWVATAKEVQFGFDAAHTHWNRNERLINTTNISRLTLLWSYQTGYIIQSQSVVANGMVYITSVDGKIYAFDATCQSACQPLWSYLTGGKGVSSPAVAEGMVYVGSDDGKIYAFDATCQSACQPLWSYLTGGKGVSSPTVANGIVYVGNNNGSHQDGKLYTFDATCRNACQPLWSYLTGNFIGSSPAVANGMVYAGSADGKLYAFDATCRNACQPLWSYLTSAPIVSSPSIADGMVYVGSENHKFYAFDAACRHACQPLWFYQANNAVGSSPAIADKMVYVGSDDGNLYAFDATCRNACQPLWSYQTGNIVYSSPMVADGIVYVGSRNGKVYAFDAACRNACQPLWSYQTGGPIIATPMIANGTVYIGSYDHNLYALGFSV